MNIEVTHAPQVPAGGTRAVPVFADLTQPSSATVELDEGFLRARRFAGKPGEILALPADDGGVVLAVGVGDRATLDADVLRRAGAASVRAAAGERLATTLHQAGGDGLRPAEAAQAVVEGVLLGAYRFTTYKRDPRPPFEALTLVGGPAKTAVAAAERGQAVARAVWLARDLVNEPPGTVTPTRLAEVATEAAGETLTVEIWDEKRVRAEGLGGLLGVAAGSAEPPRLITMTYEPPGRARGSIALVGKGITFDSGGLNIKTFEGMKTMKTDMAGAAAVIATMAALPALAPPVRVIGIVPATENLPSGTATKPGDVLRARNGTTIEVLNTDAEGRLVLADGLSLAVEAGVDAIVDLATLTGAAPQALGRKIAPFMATSDALAAQLQASAARTGEPIWPLPLYDGYRKHLDSEVADLKNIGVPNNNGTITAGLFLQAFVGDVPWAHLDIAGTAWADDEDGWSPRGGTGYGVRLLLDLLAGFRRPVG